MKVLDGKKVLLTGGSRGIGPIIAESLAKRGADIILTARSDTKLSEVVTRLNKSGFNVLGLPVDLRDSSQREQLVIDVMKNFGTIDILINNAGIETEGAYAELSWASIRENIEVNLIAPMELTRLILPGMINKKSGHIINISSIAAKSGGPYDAVYSGTKAGLAEWSRALRLELTGTGVHFSTIFPGYVREVGMFAQFGVKSPWIIGSCSPSQVAKAVINAIDKGKAEIIVNSRPLRYIFMINELSPGLGDWLMRISGAVDFQRHKVGK
ncbi:MAG: SDR family NAD(P)-dependent oxidoreductase [Bacteroidales bacterium]|nr:SDR family NAD(P)-dependent oxidoreductase [Bacteroidales bacterium]